MTPDSLRPLLEEGVILVFSKVLNASHHVRACCAVEFDHRKGFHVVERNLKQLRKAASSGSGMVLLQFKDGKILPVSEYGENPVMELPPEREEEILQRLPRFDFTARVQAQRLVRKFGPA